MPLSRILRAARASLAPPAANTTPAPLPLLLIIGNESADLDSVASAVGMAHYYAATTARRAVPVVNVPREDFALRREAVHLFEEAGVEFDALGAPVDLVFVDELDEATLAAAELVLCDHNAPTGRLAPLGGRVVAVVDHHQDAGRFGDCALRRVEPVGSACSICADLLLGAAPPVELPAALARLLLGAVLLDTINFDAGAQRFAPLDRDVAARLGARALADGESAGAFYELLKRKRCDVGELPTTDLLRMDYKQSEVGGVAVGFSSVLLSLQAMAERDSELCGRLRDWCDQRKLALLFVQTMVLDEAGAPNRQVAVYVPSALREGLAGTVCAALVGSSEPALELSEVAAPQPAATRGASLRFYEQGNAQASRKIVKPLVEAALEAPTAPAARPPGKLRILCLHGWRTSGAILKLQLRDVAAACSAEAEFVCIDAPKAASGPPQEAVGRMFQAPFFEWWDKQPGEVYEGDDASFAHLEAVCQRDGPFDGVLGFSQGAAVAAMLCGRAGVERSGFRFGVLVSGFPPRAPSLQAELESTAASAVPCFVTSGERDLLLAGCRDLASQLSGTFCTHPGGHELPTNAKGGAPAIAALRDFLSKHR